MAMWSKKMVKKKKLNKFEAYLKLWRKWTISPVTKVKKSKKIYNRKKEKQKFNNEVSNARFN